MAKGPYIPNVEPIIQAGLDPKTGLPVKMVSADGCNLKNDIKRTLRVLDEQNAVRRYRWVNLPNGLTSELIERILYYKGQAAFFFMPTDEKFYFLPYALDGTIDVYGRYTAITPLPFNGQPGTEKDGKIKPWISGLKRKVIYEMPEDYNLDDFENSCVLLHDYTQQMSENIIPRQIQQDPIIDAMAESFPMARTSLLSNSGIKGMRVNSDDDAAEVKRASKAVSKAALTGDPWVPVTAQVEFQDLTSAGSAIKSEEYLLYMQAMDNYRLSLYGLKNGGLFQKKSHMLESEQQMNDGNTSLAYLDGLLLRQHFCDLVNSIWPLGIACLPEETVMGYDANNDGFIGTQEDQSGTQEGSQDAANTQEVSE